MKRSQHQGVVSRRAVERRCSMSLFSDASSFHIGQRRESTGHCSSSTTGSFSFLAKIFWVNNTPILPIFSATRSLVPICAYLSLFSVTDDCLGAESGPTIKNIYPIGVLFTLMIIIIDPLTSLTHWLTYENSEVLPDMLKT